MRRRERGTTFIEVLAVAAIIAILASAILPLSRVTRQRQKELELRRTLRELRTSIDRFKDGVDRGQIGGTDMMASGKINHHPGRRVATKPVHRDRKIAVVDAGWMFVDQDEGPLRAGGGQQ